MKLEVLSNALIIALIIRISPLHGRLRLRIRWKTITNLQLRQFGASIQSRINRFTVEIVLCKSLICDMNYKSIYNTLQNLFRMLHIAVTTIMKEHQKTGIIVFKVCEIEKENFYQLYYSYDIVITISSMFIYMDLFCILFFYVILLYISFLLKYAFYILLTLEICEYLMYILFMVFSLRNL